jgi:hypothetical protein
LPWLQQIVHGPQQRESKLAYGFTHANDKNEECHPARTLLMFPAVGPMLAAEGPHPEKHLNHATSNTCSRFSFAKDFLPPAESQFGQRQALGYETACMKTSSKQPMLTNNYSFQHACDHLRILIGRLES